MAKDERRRSTRVFFQTTANLHFADADFSDCETVDLSMKGVFVPAISGRAIGDRCAVELQLSGTTSQLSLHMQGEVARIEAKGIAIKFFEIDLDSFNHLKNIVYYNSENPDELTGEDDPVFVFDAAEGVKDDFQ
jgi:hypothetical protein